MNRMRGFTIVELVLVLGIAGLIFLMAFLALPSLWASERDADRRATVMDFISSLKTYQTNNSRGAIPVLAGNGPDVFSISEARATNSTGDWRAFIKEYVNSDFGDPSGKEINLYVVSCRGASLNGDLNVGETCVYGTEFAGANADTVPSTGINYTLYVAVGATCDGDHAVKSANSRSVAAVYILERAGRYCYNT